MVKKTALSAVILALIVLFAVALGNPDPKIVIDRVDVKLDGTTIVTISVEDIPSPGLTEFQVTQPNYALTFDPYVIHVTEVTAVSPFVIQPPIIIDNVEGEVTFVAIAPVGAGNPGVAGDATILMLRIKAVGNAGDESDIKITPTPTAIGNGFVFRLADGTSVLPAITNGSVKIEEVPTTLAPPSDLRAFAVATDQINLSWTDNSSNEDGFQIYRRKLGESSKRIKTVTTDVTTYSDTGLKPDTTYCYKVRTYKSNHYSPLSEEVCATTGDKKPTNLKAVALTSTEVKLTWKDNSLGEWGFKIERRRGDEDYKEIAIVGANTETYIDKWAQPHTKHCYRVRAYNANSNSSYSNEACVTTDDVPPAPPSLLQLAVKTQSEIELDWKDNSDNESGFKVERAAQGENYKQIATVGADEISYLDKDLSGNTTYCYRVRAYNTAGGSPYTDERCATTPQATVPKAPSNLTLKVISSNRIDLSWQDNSDNEEGFKLERKLVNGKFAQIATVKADVTGYQDKALSPGRTYCYRVRAYNGDKDSPYSNETCATTKRLTAPVAPSNLKLKAASATQIDLSWKDNSDNEEGFSIERHEGSSYREIATVKADKTAYSDKGLTPDTRYCYRLRAYNAAGASAFSNEACITTPLATSGTLTISGTTLTQGDRGKIRIGVKGIPAPGLSVIQVGPHEGALTFDPAVIQVERVVGVNNFGVIYRIDNYKGRVTFGAFYRGSGGVTAGDIVELEIRAVAEGSTEISITGIDLAEDAQGKELGLSSGKGKAEVTEATSSAAGPAISVFPNPITSSSAEFIVQGRGVKEIEVRVFNLAGAQVFDSGFVAGNTLEWHLLNNQGEALANGVYLYVVTVRGYDGTVVRSVVRKLVILR